MDGQDPSDPTGALGPNAWIVDEMRDRWLADPDSVDAGWRALFEGGEPAAAGAQPAEARPAAAADSPDVGAPPERSFAATTAATANDLQLEMPTRAEPLRHQTPRPVPDPAADHTPTGELIRGVGARIVANMEASLAVPDRDELPRHPREAPGDKPQDRQRLPGPQAGREGFVHPSHRVRGRASHRRHRRCHEQHLHHRRRRGGRGSFALSTSGWGSPSTCPGQTAPAP